MGGGGDTGADGALQPRRVHDVEPASGLAFRVSRFGVRDFNFRFWGIRFQASSIFFWILGFGFTVFGLGFWVLGFGFRVFGFWFRFSVSDFREQDSRLRA